MLTFYLLIIYSGTFVVSGICKIILSERTLMRTGQTGVEGLGPTRTKAIGTAEILGVSGIWLPHLTGVAPWLPTVAIIALAAIMVPAAVVHYRRKEDHVILVNLMILAVGVYLAFAA